MAPLLPHTNHKGSSFIRETERDCWTLYSRETVHTHSSPRLKADWHRATCQLELPLLRTPAHMLWRTVGNASSTPTNTV
jgi:hypothetical protein